jgi:hypothetical protein
MHLMRAEAEERLEEVEAVFTNDLFLHRPEIYDSMYSQEAIEDEVEFITPDAGEEFKEMLNEMRAAGLVK